MIGLVRSSHTELFCERCSEKYCKTFMATPTMESSFPSHIRGIIGLISNGEVVTIEITLHLCWLTKRCIFIPLLP